MNEAIKQFFVVLIGLLRSERGVARARILVAGTIAASAVMVVSSVVVTDHAPIARFTASPEPSVAGSPTTFDASTSTCADTPCTYHWHDIGAGGTSDIALGANGVSSSYTYASAGTSYVELVVTDVDGDVSTVEHTHTINAAQTGSCDSTISSGSVSTALGSVPAGGTLCLNAGSYTYNAAVSKTSLTTAKPVTGASVTYTSLNMSTSNNIRIEGPGTIPGFAIGTNTSSGTNLQISNFTSNSSACIQAPSNIANNIVIDKIIFNNIGESCTEGRLGIAGMNTNHSVNQNITVKNSSFTGSGPSDGIQGNGDVTGLNLGPGNTFQNIQEGGCGSVHCDSIQCYGCNNVKVTGSYFYNNSTLAVDFDCNSGFSQISDNVFYQEPSSAANAVVMDGETNGLQIFHNTFGPNTNLQIYGGNPGNCTTSNAVIANNISQGGFNISNCSGCTQTNNIANPIYVGGGTPTTWAGWALTSGSPGKGTATDGGDVGARQTCAPGSC